MLTALILILIVVAVGATTTLVMKKRKETGGAGGFFSVDTMAEKLLLLLKRFPVTLLSVIGLAVLFFIGINNSYDDVSYELWFFFSIGAFISVTVTLFVEDFFSEWKTCGFSLLALLLWGAYCFLLPEKIDDVHINKGIELFVIGATAFLAMLFISFLKKNSDRAFWNFATYTLSQMVLACFFGLILFGGLSLALFAIDSLFDSSIPDKVYANLAVACFVLFAPIYFLANVPGKGEKHNNEIFYAKTQKILALYILTPVLVVYAVILYAYLFKIVVAWELPNGWVSWLVSALGLGGLLVIALLYPIREHENNKVATFIFRWLGVLILPLLVLMTIGISRRIGDYGITINRGYILILNLWFYGIYAYLFFTQSRHIKWILISPVVLAFLSSISVWSIANVTKNSLTKEVHALLSDKVSSEDAKLKLAGMAEEERQRVKSALEYLYDYYGKESVQVFFADSIANNSWALFKELGLDYISKEIAGERILYYANSDKTWNVECYNTFTEINYYEFEEANDTVKIPVGNHVFEIPAREIALEYLSADKKIQDEKDWTIRGENYTLLISFFDGSYYATKDSISITRLGGYLLYNTAP